MARRHHPLLSARLRVVGIAIVAFASGCGSDAADQAGGDASITTTAPTDPSATTDEPATIDEDGNDAAAELFPDVIAAEATQANDGTWTFSATLSSPYDTPERYADAWRVLGPDGTEYGRRDLAHDHANEQPFTRSQSGIEIPDGIDVVTVQGRDQVSGWGGATVEVELEPDG